MPAGCDLQAGASPDLKTGMNRLNLREERHAHKKSEGTEA